LAFNIGRKFEIPTSHVGKLYIENLPAGYQIILEESVLHTSHCGPVQTWHILTDECGEAEGICPCDKSYDLAVPGLYRAVVVKCDGTTPSAAALADLKIYARIIDDPNGVVAENILSKGSHMSCCCNSSGGSVVTVTSTADSIILVVDGVPTVIPKALSVAEINALIAAAIAAIPNASESIRGLVELATAAETGAASSNSLALTPAGLAGAMNASGGPNDMQRAVTNALEAGIATDQGAQTAIANAIVDEVVDGILNDPDVLDALKAGLDGLFCEQMADLPVIAKIGG
jgi:hypothetical protein